MTPDPTTRASRRHARRERSRTDYAGDWLAVEHLGADGLVVRSDGAFVRYLEVSPTNPLVLSDAECVELSRAFGAVASRIPARMTATIHVQATPLPIDQLLSEVADHVDGHTENLQTQAQHANGNAAALTARAAALRAFGDGEQASLAEHAETQAAMEIRYYVIVPYMPGLPVRPGLDDLIPGRRETSAPLTRTRDSHRQVAHKSLALTEAIRQDLEALDLAVQRLDGPAVAQLLWRSFAPHQAVTTPQQGPRLEALEVLGEVEDRHDHTQARHVAAQLRDMIATSPPDDTHSRRWIELDGGLEQTIYLSGPPEHTFYGWLLYAMQSTSPWTLTVHIHALDRMVERRRYRQRRKRLWGANRGREREGKMDDPEQLDQEHEVTDLVSELSLSPNAAVYELSVYQRIRQPGPDASASALTDAVDQAIRDISQPVDVRVQREGATQLELWQSTVPLGLDVARKTFRVVTRHAGDTLPLIGTNCGSPDGIPFAFSQSRTVQRLNPFDTAHENGTMVVNGKSGSGKTMSTVIMLMRALARGAHGAVIDRAGHYQFLCSLIPDAVHCDVGAGEHTVNPWDTDDVTNVPAAKIEFLRSLHAILVGAHNATQDSFGLEALERNLLSLAIRGTYDTAAQTGATPCESLLQAELYARAADAKEQGTPEIAAIYASLAERLHDYCGEGPAAALLDRPTTVPADAPLVAFDLRHVQDDALAAVIFVLAEYVEQRVEQLRERRLAAVAAGAPRNLFDQRFVFVAEELWKLLARQATGEWANDLARRARHLGLFLIAVTQQLSDLDNDYGRALLRNSTMKLCLAQAPDELVGARQALGLGDEEIDTISHLKTSKRQFADAYFINGARGRGRITIRVAAAEYWTATSEPLIDVPLRERALQETNGDPWAALALLCDPAWHETH